MAAGVGYRHPTSGTNPGVRRRLAMQDSCLLRCSDNCLFGVCMSKTRERVYKYISERLRAGDPPTIREVQKAMGLRAVESARTHLEGLVKEGRLVKRDTRSRSYALPPEVWSPSQTRRVPVVGQVQAGALTLALEEPEGFIHIERDRYGEQLFALRVRGASMEGAGILPGDLVITRRQPQAEEGDIVVAMVEEEATLKRLHFEGRNKVVLRAENPEFKPIILDAEELQLLGKVVEIRRYYELVPFE